MQDYRMTYPVSVKAAVYQSLLYRESISNSIEVPFPTLAGIRDFAWFAGIKDNAVRTALSRGKGAGEIEAFEDERKTQRYRLVDGKLALRMVEIRSEKPRDGYVLFVFSLTGEAIEKRANVKEVLKNFGFRQWAPGVYIAGAFDIAPLEAILKKFQIDEYVDVFFVGSEQSSSIERKISTLFRLERRNEALKKFVEDSRIWLEDLDSEDGVKKLIYVGLYHWENFVTTEPPLPASAFAADYPYQAFSKWLDELNARLFLKIVAYFRAAHSA